jgi:hypothetical protein
MRELQIPVAFVVTLAAAGLLVSTSVARADVEEAATAAVGQAEVSPSDAPTTGCASLPPCCAKPCIRYRHHRLRRSGCCYDCRPPVNVILELTDPCCCCAEPVAVPVCLPACCEGVPTVCERCGLLGRGVVNYRWCCGYRVKIVFHRDGDITVHCYGC